MSSTATEEGGVGAEGAGPAPLKVLFFLRGDDYDRAFENLLRAMLGRAHEVLVALQHRGGPPQTTIQLFDELRERYPAFNHRRTPPRRGVWRIVASAIRRSLDYLHFLEPEQAGADQLRDEARDGAPRALRALLFLPPFRWQSGRRLLGWLLRRLEAGMPIPRSLKSFTKGAAPDVVLVSPLVELDPAQGDFIRTAEAATVPTVLVVVSWDDLVARRVWDVPTLTVVSNEEQLDEAVSLHGVAEDRIEAVGAQSFDGLDAPAAPGAVEAIERAAPTKVVPRPEGRLLRPILWLLTPLMAIVVALLRPRATARAVIRSVQRLGVRIRKRGRRLRRSLRQRRARRAEANARAAKEEKTRARAAKAGQKESAAAAKQQERASARAAKAEKKGEARGGTGGQKARSRPAKGAKARGEKQAIRAARAKGGETPKQAPSGKRARERGRPPIWRRKAVRGRLHALRRRWKYTRRGVRRVYNRRYRFTYRRTITRVPARDELPALLNARGLLGRGAEIGVKTGRYSDELLSNWRGEELISIDPWLSANPDEYVDRSNVSQQEFEQFYQQTRERLARHGTRSAIWRMTSVEAARKVPDRSLDFVYIDARHDYESVKEDVAAWCSKVRPGGILAGHDYVDGDLPEGEFYVKSAVDEFFAARDIPVHATEGRSAVESFPTWIVEVPEEGLTPTPAQRAGREATTATVEKAGDPV